ncbi:MAG: hypothetical protein VW518_00510 [Burkholderiaceae bacterium]
MGIKFGDATGSAQKTTLDQYTYKNGANAVRLFGDLLPRYIYWIKGENDKNLPVECLAFDRQTERFTNVEKDWVKTYYPDLKSNWAYSIQCIDLADGKAKLFNLKKKLMDQILMASQELGDPTDPESGWEVHFDRKKNGPHVYNVEYTLNVLKCSKNVGPLTEAQVDAIAASTPIDELLPRPTPDAQREFLERLATGGNDNVDEEVIDDEFDVA